MRPSMAITRWFSIALAGFGCLYIQVIGLHGASPQASADSAAVSSQRALLNKYCVTCHNERLRTAGLTLDKANLEDVGGNAEVWEKVLRKVRTGAMPPAGMPRPDQATFDAFSSWLEASLDRAAAAKPNPGR